MENNTDEIIGRRDIRAVKNTKGRFIFCTHVVGNTLKASRIFDGDLLVVMSVKDFNEKSLYVWETPEGRTAKYAFEFLGDITLHNKGTWFRRFKKKEVKLLGLVVRIERDLEVLND
jgi:SOS-response transcriptional repressor LexA